jgi:hypothetical protein
MNPRDDGVLGGFRIPQTHLLRRSEQHVNWARAVILTR